jgi:hypothetical protein
VPDFARCLRSPRRQSACGQCITTMLEHGERPSQVHAAKRFFRRLHNRAENSHRPTRRRERPMQRFKTPRQPRTFSAPTRSSMATSIRAETDLQPMPIVRPGPTLSRLGSRRPLPDTQLDCRGTTILGSALSTRS